MLVDMRDFRERSWHPHSSSGPQNAQSWLGLVALSCVRSLATEEINDKYPEGLHDNDIPDCDLDQLCFLVNRTASHEQPPHAGTYRRIAECPLLAHALLEPVS